MTKLFIKYLEENPEVRVTNPHLGDEIYYFDKNEGYIIGIIIEVYKCTKVVKLINIYNNILKKSYKDIFHTLTAK